jgi:hypothetical protein
MVHLVVVLVCEARLTMVVVTLRTGTALTTVATLRTLTTLATLGAVATRTTLTLHITLGFGDEHTVRELILASLRVNLQELHGNLVALLQTSFLDSLQTLPVNL